jgi:adenosyl cobinamide kinase/adenosyl cobinamide phosphate guanylyltransferase
LYRDENRCDHPGHNFNDEGQIFLGHLILHHVGTLNFGNNEQVLHLRIEQHVAKRQKDIWDVFQYDPKNKNLEEQVTYKMIVYAICVDLFPALLMSNHFLTSSKFSAAIQKAMPRKQS